MNRSATQSVVSSAVVPLRLHQNNLNNNKCKLSNHKAKLRIGEERETVMLTPSSLQSVWMRTRETCRFADGICSSWYVLFFH